MNGTGASLMLFGGARGVCQGFQPGTNRLDLAVCTPEAVRRRARRNAGLYRGCNNDEEGGRRMAKMYLSIQETTEGGVFTVTLKI